MPSPLLPEPNEMSQKNQISWEFEIGEEILGKGTYSEVRLAKNLQTKEMVAVKMIDLKKHRNYYNREIVALSNVTPHENLISLVQYGEDEDMGYIFTEYSQPKTLDDFLNEKGPLEEEDALKIFAQLVDGVETIHQSKFSHHDLKPENILYDEKTGKTKIFDFGLSLSLDESGNVEDCCGSPLYMSPEVLSRRPHNAILSDIWSLGLIFYQILVGSLPWVGIQTLDELISTVFQDKIYFPRFLSRGIRKLLIGMLQFQPRARLSLKKIKEMISSLLSNFKTRRGFEMRMA